MPITRLELLLGKYLGLAGAGLSTVAGFGLVGVMLSAARRPRAVPLLRLHAPARCCSAGLPQPGGDAVDAADRTRASRHGDRHLVLLRAGVRPAGAGACWSSRPAPGGAGSAPTCCCSTRRTSSASSTSSRSTTCAALRPRHLVPPRWAALADGRGDGGVDRRCRWRWPPGDSDHERFHDLRLPSRAAAC